ncbi:SGNH/GDSL hydrolase family protein [Mollicutes bacterium LVI A0039]|nr:SGNH/GDSL hydrolase family protein [Mollicutes bacterium LVI A0039]
MNKKNIVFIGDSITAGVIAGPELDYRKKGYAGFIKEYFEKHDLLGSYYNFAVSGFMTGDVLAQFKANITHNENIAFNVLSEKCYRFTKKRVEGDTIKFTHPDVRILDTIEKADLLVMTVGANDLIRLFRKFSDESVVKVIHSIISNEYTQETLHVALKNYLIIMNLITEINPDIEIILVGTYVPSGDQAIVKRLFPKFSMLEDALYDTVANEFPENIKLVKPRNIFKANCKEYVTSKIDIHPSTLGHKAIAELVMQKQETVMYNKGEILSYKQNQV